MATPDSVFPLTPAFWERIPRTCSRLEPLNLRAGFSPSPPDAGRRRGLGRGGAFTLDAPLLGPLPTRPSWGEEVTSQVGGRFMGRESSPQCRTSCRLISKFDTHRTA